MTHPNQQWIFGAFMFAFLILGLIYFFATEVF